MSMQRACLLVKWTDKWWYLIVATDEHDYDYESFTIYGPGDTEDKVWDMMTESNPGSFGTTICQRQKDLQNEKLRKALKKYIRDGYRNAPFKLVKAYVRRRVW